MKENVIKKINKINPAGLEGFEGLIAQLLGKLTNRKFFLAHSGSQSGRDANTAPYLGNVIAIECKRYGKASLSERELLGELAQISEDIPELELWILVVSRNVSTQLISSLSSLAKKLGIEVRVISDDGSPSTLEALFGLYPEVIMTFLKSKISSEELKSIEDDLNKIKLSPGFSVTIKDLKEEFSNATLGYYNWSQSQNNWLIKYFGSETESRHVFKQVLNVNDKSVRYIEREKAFEELDNWLSNWQENKPSFVLLGEEGDGKTWATAGWISKKIRNEKEFPPVLFIPSLNVNSKEIEKLIETNIESINPEPYMGYWRKKLDSWLERPHKNMPSIIVVLDGINERQKPSFWREIFEECIGEKYFGRIALLVTCRESYWKLNFSNLRHINFSTWTLLPYNDKELSEALLNYGLSKDDISENLLPLIKKPRYFDLAVKFRKQMAMNGDITVARLIYEDWRDRMSKKVGTDLDDEQFQDILKNLAHKSLEEDIFDKDIIELLPYQEDKRAILDELWTGGILKRHGIKYQVQENSLKLGFGLILADEVLKESSKKDSMIFEVIAQWLEPYPEIDLKASICGMAALHSLQSPNYSRKARVSLLYYWLNCLNSGTELDASLPEYLPLDPSAYFELAEIIWTYENENKWGQELVMKALLKWVDSPQVNPKLSFVFERWLGLVHLEGFKIQREISKDKNLKGEIIDRLGFEPTTPEFEFSGYTFYKVQDEGLLRLGRVALRVISVLPKEKFIRAIIVGCLAEEIMGFTNKYGLFSWVLKSAREELWSDLKREILLLKESDHLINRRALTKILRYQGGVEAYQLSQTIEPQKRNLYTSGFSRNIDEYEPLTAATQIRTFCINPVFPVSDQLKNKFNDAVNDFEVDTLWSGEWKSSSDHLLEYIEPAYCAYAPSALIGLIRRIFQRISVLNENNLRRMAFEIDEYFIIFDQDVHDEIYKTWLRLHSKRDSLTEKEVDAEEFLFAFILQMIGSSKQLAYLLERTEESLDLLLYLPFFKPISNWGEVEKLIRETKEIESLRRILWFISKYPEFIPKNIMSIIQNYISHDDTGLRRSTLKLIYTTGYGVDAFVNSAWKWCHSENAEEENYWGSLLLSEFGESLSLNELKSRIDPLYLGYAIMKRGYQNNEIREYAAMLNDYIECLKFDFSDLPEYIPNIEVEINSDGESIFKEQKKLSDETFTKTIKFISSESYWGGTFGTKNGHDPFKSIGQDDIDSKYQLLREIINVQRAARNYSFSKLFYPYGLNEIFKTEPELFSQWVEIVLKNQPEAKKCLFLGRSFYEAICTALLNNESSKGIQLYWKLINEESPIRNQYENLRLSILDFSLFKATLNSDVLLAWDKYLEGCKNDYDLLEVMLLARLGNGNEWMQSHIEKELSSCVLFEKARAIILLGFVDDDNVTQVLNEKYEIQPDSWIKAIIETSLNRLNKNIWAKHWFSQFCELEDDDLSWSSFRLFLKCVDRRFWIWNKTFEQRIPKHKVNRLTFLKINYSTINKNIKQNESELKKVFLTENVLDGEVWPWIN